MNQHDAVPDWASGRVFDYPRGWFVVATPESIPASEAVALPFFGRTLVAFRGADGDVAILDSVCPHMGASLAIGGVVEEGEVRCPFHHWRFGPDGRCSHIPYSKLIPPQAKVHSYPVREQNGLVLLWFDPEHGAPDYEIPDLDDYYDQQWVPWAIVRRDIRTVPLEIVDNIADSAHLGPVHQSWPRVFEVEFDGHRAIQTQFASHETLTDIPGGEMKTVATYHGPSYLLTSIEGRYRSWMLLAHTPIDQSHVAVWYGLMIRSDDGVTPEFQEIAREYAAAGQVSAYQDVDIWENKSLSERPALCRDDGPILDARRWYTQFLKPRARAETSEITQ
ncbi:(2Fe-2S)-binding protein [Sphingomonas sp. DBB INV C78]